MEKVKKVCIRCKTFTDDKKHGSYKCAIKGRCPGRDWTDSKKKRYILNQQSTSYVELIIKRAKFMCTEQEPHVL